MFVVIGLLIPFESNPVPFHPLPGAGNIAGAQPPVLIFISDRKREAKERMLTVNYSSRDITTMN